MDRVMLVDHLALAERHIHEGERIVAKQRALVEKRKGEGRDIEVTKLLLEEFERTLQTFLIDRERLRRILKGMDAT